VTTQPSFYRPALRPAAARRRQRGSVMIQALIVLAGLVALLATLAANQRTALDAIQNGLRQRRAEMAARGGMERALAVLQAATPDLVMPADDWAQLSDSGNTAFDLGGATFRMQIIDAGSLINVNSATEQQLNLLPLTPEQIDSLLDWRSAGTTARANGAKDDYYQGLTTPYNAKLGRLNSLSELLLIKGWTAQGLYAAQTAVISTAAPIQDVNGNPLPLVDVLTVSSGTPNTQADGTARINLGQGRLTAATFNRLGIRGPVAAQLASRGPYTTLQSLLRQPGVTGNIARTILQRATVTTGTRLQGKINLNTASQAVLATLPGITTDTAAAIVQQQASGFTTLGDLSRIGGLSGTRLAQVADAFGVGSDTFVVRTYGESGGVGCAYEAEIGIRNKTARLISFERVSAVGLPSWWNWTDQPNSTVDSGDSQVSTTSGAVRSIGGAP
jgi:type II secretory pathway component PulK